MNNSLSLIKELDIDISSAYKNAVVFNTIPNFELIVEEISVEVAKTSTEITKEQAEHYLSITREPYDDEKLHALLYAQKGGLEPSDVFNQLMLKKYSFELKKEYFWMPVKGVW